MDTTKKYIEVCEKAEEIQQKRNHKNWENGDFVYLNRDIPVDGYYKGIRVIWNNLLPNTGFHNWDNDWSLPNGLIWLPRQDQLQEILDPCCLEDLIRDFSMWFAWRLGDEGTGFRTSMEQLWLAFVMKEKYKKMWNGKEWMK